jgi:Asp-tRNA(Asn)/Glu-tRNA(Gln) amidotransferase A subunit family amidase
MLMGAPFGEERLLRLGAAAEAALGGRRKSHNPA